jgi:hypothetical protein
LLLRRTIGRPPAEAPRDLYGKPIQFHSEVIRTLVVRYVFAALLRGWTVADEV